MEMKVNMISEGVLELKWFSSVGEIAVVEDLNQWGEIQH